jgi:myo-inositol-1(or 4)-monophosphatase
VSNKPPSKELPSSSDFTFSPELSVARHAAQIAAEIITGYYRDGFSVHTKENAAETYNLVSDADLAAEKAIVEIIRESYPDHAFIAEETHTADSDAGHLWVIDPLDGTTNFIHGIPHFAVSIAYYQKGTAICGVVVNPVRNDWYVVQRGAGAFVNGQRAQVATHKDLTESLVGVGFYYDRGEMMRSTLAAIGELFERNIHGIRRFGTAALDLCLVGSGQVGAFFEYQLSPWDFAAGRLFVEEAGGRITNCAGEPLPLSVTSVLASNGVLHDSVLSIVRDHLPRNMP